MLNLISGIKKVQAEIRSSVYLATDYGLDDQGLVPGRGKTFLFSIIFRPALGPTQRLFWPGLEAVRSPLTSGDIKNGGAILSLPMLLHGIMIICL